MSRIGNKPDRDPRGRHRRRRPWPRHGERAQGRARPGDRPATWTVKVDDGVLTVTRPTDRGEHRALHGLTRSLIANMVEGVTNGFEKRLADPGRRLPRQARGQVARALARLLAPGQRPGSRRDRVRGPAADRGDRPRDRQAARRRDRRSDPPPPAAGALQGQGRSLRRRAGPPQGRQAGPIRDRVSMAVKTAQQRRLRRRRRVRAKVRGSAARPRLAVYRSNRGLYAQLIDDDARPHAGPGELDRGRAAEARRRRARQARRRAARRAGQGRRRRDLHLRSRRLPLPRPRRRPRRRRPRGRPAVLSFERDLDH